jgi:starvation-inducible DNA-binding protein
MNKDLIEALKIALADTFAFYLKAHNFHWNVTGPNFSEYHKFLGDLWEETFDAVDLIAEGIRTLDAFAPGSFTRFKELSTIEDELKIPSAIDMIKKLEEDNKKVLASLLKAYDLAEKDKKHGISNFLQDRITAHEKHGWMLRSFTKA